MAKRLSGGETSLSMGDLRRETGGKAPLLGILNNREKRLWKRTSISIGPRWGTWKGARLPGL